MAQVETSTIEIVRLLKGTLLGSMLGAIAYGVAADLYFTCLYLRFKTRALETTKRSRDMLLLIHTSLMFVAVTVIISSNIWSLWNLFPMNNGSDTLEIPSYVRQDGIGYVGIFATFVNNWLADGLLIWRCYTLLRGDRRILRVGAVTTLLVMLLAVIVLSVIEMIQIRGTTTTDSGIITAVLLLSLVINCIATGVIVIRLLIHRHRIIRTIGYAHGEVYLHIVIVLTESAALVLIFEILILAAFFRSSTGLVPNLSIQLIGHIQAIASFLIIFRILQGKAWSSSPVPSKSTSGNASSQSLAFLNKTDNDIEQRLSVISGEIA